MAVNRKRAGAATAMCAWALALALFFPVLWMALASFKTEIDAVAEPSFFFAATFDNYIEAQARADYLKFARNSVVVSLGATLLALLVAMPAAWAMAFHPTPRARFTLLWMLSTKMLPPVGALVPVYLLFRDAGLLDTLTGLIFVYALVNLPIVVWMLYTYYKDVPAEILEAARMDGAGAGRELLLILLPMTAGATASTFLLSFILAWNEAFWSIHLTASDAAPLTAFIASFSSPEGLFWAKLSAASVMAVAPVMALGWFCQKRLVRGLTFGAVK